MQKYLAILLLSSLAAFGQTSTNRYSILTAEQTSNFVYNVVQSSTNLSSSDSVFNVKRYGAAGDGITDDSVAIKSAWDALMAAGKGVLYFPSGKYLDSGSYSLTTASRNVGYNLSSFEIKGDGPSASQWKSSMGNGAFIIFSGNTLSFSDIGILYAGSSTCTGVVSKTTGTVYMHKVNFSGFDVGAFLPLTCGGIITSAEFDTCRIGLWLPSYADGWTCNLGIHKNTVGVMIGGAYPWNSEYSVYRANGVKLHVNGHANGWPVVVGTKSSATYITGYVEDSTNAVVAIGMPSGYIDDLANETYVGQVIVDNLAGVNTKVAACPSVKIYSTNAIYVALRNVALASDAVEFANPYSETNCCITIDGCKSAKIKLSTGLYVQQVTGFNNVASRRVTWNLTEENYSYRDWTNAYFAVLPWHRVRIGERLTAKPYAADGVQQGMLYSFISSVNNASLLYGGGSGETKPYSSHAWYVGTASTAGAGTKVMYLDTTGLYVNAINLTNFSTKVVTNLANQTTIDSSLASGLVTLSSSATISGYLNMSSTYANKFSIIWTNSSAANITLTFPVGTKIAHLSAQGSRSCVVTNGGIAQGDFLIYPGVTTNLLFSTPY